LDDLTPPRWPGGTFQIITLLESTIEGTRDGANVKSVTSHFRCQHSLLSFSVSHHFLWWTKSCFAFAWQGKYHGAGEQAKRASDLDPAYFFPQMAYGWIDIEAGKIHDAIPELRRAKAMESPAFVTAFLGYAYGASGDRARAMAEMEDLKRRSLHGHVLPFNLALVYIGLGDRERALDHLERAYASDSQWMGLKNDRIFDPLRSEPRFVALMRKLRFDN